jgi:hypothetical protein
MPTQVFTQGHMDDFMLLAMILAGVNAIPPLLFLVYMFTKGRIFRASVVLAQTAHSLLFVGELLTDMTQSQACSLEEQAVCLICSVNGTERVCRTILAVGVSVTADNMPVIQCCKGAVFYVCWLSARLHAIKHKGCYEGCCRRAAMIHGSEEACMALAAAAAGDGDNLPTA